MNAATLAPIPADLAALLARYGAGPDELEESLAREDGSIPEPTPPARGIDGLAFQPLGLPAGDGAAALPTARACGLQLRVVCRILWAALLRWGRPLQAYPRSERVLFAGRVFHRPILGVPYHPGDLATLEPWIADATDNLLVWTWIYLYGRGLAERYAAEVGRRHADHTCLDWLGQQPALVCGGPVLGEYRRHPAAAFPAFPVTARTPEAILWRWSRACARARAEGIGEGVIGAVVRGHRSPLPPSHPLVRAAKVTLAAGWEDVDLIQAADSRAACPPRARAA